MSAKALSLLLIAPTVLAASASAYAQTAPPAPAEAPAAPAPAPAPAKEEAPPPPPAPAAAEPVNPWFVRKPYDVTLGTGKEAWKMTIYGFAEADFMNDSTRSFADGMNSNVVAHDNTQLGNEGRTQFTIRNSRLGFKLVSPEVGGVRPSAVLETDFFGNQPPNASEAAFFNNPTWRIRHAQVKLDTDYVDFMAGQGYYLFGWQNYFFPATIAFLGVPNLTFNRTQQIRLSHTFKTDAVNVDFAVGAFRPPQRDSSLPEGEAGLKLNINNWKAINTPGSGGTAAFPASIGVSGLVRGYKVDGFVGNNNPAKSTYSTEKDTGWAISINALIPIIPAQDSTDRGNALTLSGWYTNGTAYADQFTGMNFGANLGTVPNPTGAMPAPTYTPDVDPGQVMFDAGGHLHTIDWMTYGVGLQYYLPPSGRVFVSGNYTHGESDNMVGLFGSKATGIFQKSTYFDGNIFFVATPAAQLGVSGQYVTQEFCDGTNARDIRYEFYSIYFF